jgi:hypothetical protein
VGGGVDRNVDRQVRRDEQKANKPDILHTLLTLELAYSTPAAGMAGEVAVSTNAVARAIPRNAISPIFRSRITPIVVLLVRPHAARKTIVQAAAPASALGLTFSIKLRTDWSIGRESSQLVGPLLTST